MLLLFELGLFKWLWGLLKVRHIFIIRGDWRMIDILSSDCVLLLLLTCSNINCPSVILLVFIIISRVSFIFLKLISQKAQILIQSSSILWWIIRSHIQAYILKKFNELLIFIKYFQTLRLNPFLIIRFNRLLLSVRAHCSLALRVKIWWARASCLITEWVIVMMPAIPIIITIVFISCLSLKWLPLSCWNARLWCWILALIEIFSLRA